VRIVLDTNVIVAGIAYPAGPAGRIVSAWRSGALEVVLSHWILTECERVLPRLRPFTAMPPADIRDLVETLAFMAEIVEPDRAALAQAADARVRDCADEPVLATLLVSGAEAMVTGDKDLLALSHRFAILSPAEFCARYAP
jgi:putative PIN family toxin of toxin-antitoxin system